VYHATRPPLKRFMATDQAIRSSSRPSAMSLSREFGLGARTIARDITYMHEQLGAPIKLGPVRNGYHFRAVWPGPDRLVLRNEESPISDQRSNEQRRSTEPERIRAKSTRQRRVRPVG